MQILLSFRSMSCCVNAGEPVLQTAPTVTRFHQYLLIPPHIPLYKTPLQDPLCLNIFGYVTTTCTQTTVGETKWLSENSASNGGGKGGLWKGGRSDYIIRYYLVISS